MILCMLRWWRRLRAGLDDDRRGWPPLDPGPSVPRIYASQAAQRMREAEATGGIPVWGEVDPWPGRPILGLRREEP